MRMTFTRLAAALLIGWSGVAAAAEGVRLHLKNGSVVEGELLSESGGKYVVVIAMGSGRATVTIEAGKVDRVERGLDLDVPAAPTPADEAPAATPEPSATQPSAAAPVESRESPASRAAGTPVVQIPMAGPMGFDETLDDATVIAEGVRAGLEAAKRLKITEAVLEIDSVTGSMVGAQAVADVLAEFADDFTFHAWIKRAAGPALLVVFSCDTWHFRPGAEADAVVMTGGERLSEASQRDFADRLAAIARRCGHSEALARALVQRRAVLYAPEAGAAGEATLTAEDAEGVVELDGLGTVYAPTAQDLIGLGIGEKAETPAAIGELLGAAWQSPRDHARIVARETTRFIKAERQRRETVAQMTERIAKVREVAASLETLVRRAKDLDPGLGVYHVFEQTDEWDSESQQRWRTATDRALAAWNAARSTADATAREYTKVLREIEALEREQGKSVHPLLRERAAADAATLRAAMDEGNTVKKQVEATIAVADQTIPQLQADRNRTRP